MIKPLTIAEVEFIAYELARKTMIWDEPIPAFETRFPNVLESCLFTPFATYDRKSLYHGLTGKAAILFYLMVKNHPFQNGNKRTAITTLFSFLAKNNKWLEVDTESLYRNAVWAAESPAEHKDQVVQAFENFIKKYMIKREF